MVTICNEKMKSLALDERDMEILKDVLEAHYESLTDALRDCVMDEDTRFQYKDELTRIGRIWEYIWPEDFQ